jgi:hypothetical protein
MSHTIESKPFCRNVKWHQELRYDTKEPCSSCGAVNSDYEWKGDGPKPASWYAPDGTKVYRSYEDYCDD